MIIHDISLTTTSETVTWDDSESGYTLKWVSRIGPGSVANGSVITLGAHTGTHLDAPLHFIEGGNSVERLDINVLVGPAQVVEIYDRDSITAADLDVAGIASETSRILFKTDNTKRRLIHEPKFHRDYVGVAPSGATWLVQHGIKLVGIDYLSIGPYGSENIDTHQTLLGASVVALETLDLGAVSAGSYFLAALPPKIEGAEGCPCRVVLIEGLSV